MRRSKRLTIARRELASLRSEKTIVLAVLIQLFVAAFSSFLVVGLVSLYDPASVSGDGSVDVALTGDAGDDLARVAAERPGIDVGRYGTYDDAFAAFQRGEVSAVLRADRGADGRTVVTAVVPDGGFRTTFVVVQLRDVLQAFERSERARMDSRLVRSPLPLPPESDGSPYFGFTYTVLIPLLMFLPVFVSGSIAVDSIVEELDRGTFELLRVSPLSLVQIVDGKLFAMAVLVPVQAGSWLALLSLNGTAIANAPAVLVLVSALAVVVVALGIAVALAAGDRSRAQFAYSVAILGVFGVTYLLPESPANAVAKLVIGSPGPTTWLLVLASPAVALLALAGLRRLVARADRVGV